MSSQTTLKTKQFGCIFQNVFGKINALRHKILHTSRGTTTHLFGGLAWEAINRHWQKLLRIMLTA